MGTCGAGSRPKAAAALAAGLLSTVLAASEVQAFHDGGVAHCGGCHIMHESEDGLPPSVPASGALLRDSTASEVCLTCHAGRLGRVLSGSPLAPSPELGAGNFVFLLEDNLNDGPLGAVAPIPGDAAGHNLDAPGWGLAPDPRHAVSPGGNFPAGQMSCTSCHDPHGNGNFRLLHGVGPVQRGVFTFTAPAPTAEGLALVGAAESASQHSAYRGGVSAWCGNCHDARYHDRNPGPRLQDHPTDQALGSGEAERYNRYNGDADPGGGSMATAYLAQVPFESAASGTGSTAGPSPSARIMCLSCHRAHASSAPAAGRWDFNVTFLHEDGIESGSLPLPSPYPDPGQRQLCYKCHDWAWEGN